GLSGLKNACYVNRSFLKRESLRFVHGNGPGEFNRIVNISTYNLFFNLVRIRIYKVAYVLPFVTLHADAGAILKRDYNFLFAQCDYDSCFAVIKKFFGRWIVFDKHDLRAYPQSQFFLYRTYKGRKCAINLGPEYKLGRFQSIERGLIDCI